MAEQFANVIRTTAASATGNAHVDAIAAAILAPGTRWTRPLAEAGKVLLECSATGAQVVLHGTATNIQVGYAPDGGVVDWNGVPTAPVFTGMRNITGASTNFAAGVTSTVDIAEYEDALMFAVGYNVAGWRYAAMAGKCIEPVDLSDDARKIGTDALLVGIPSALATPGNWLSSVAGSTTIGSCVRTGNSFDQLITLTGFVWLAGTAAGDRVLARIGDVERMVPYQMHVLTTAAAQYVGATKYIRQWRANVAHGTRLFSDTALSAQAWFGYQYDATSRNQFVLWAKTETTV